MDKRIKLSVAADRIGLRPKTLKMNYITTGKFNPDKLNATRLGPPPRGRIFVLSSEVDRFIKMISDKG